MKRNIYENKKSKYKLKNGFCLLSFYKYALYETRIIMLK